MPRFVSGYNHSFILGGLISFVCYLIVLSAYQHLPVALVSSLRETSILFAVLLGVLTLKEKFTLDKVILVTLLVAGVNTLLALSVGRVWCKIAFCTRLFMGSLLLFRLCFTIVTLFPLGYYAVLISSRPSKFVIDQFSIHFLKEIWKHRVWRNFGCIGDY